MSLLANASQPFSDKSYYAANLPSGVNYGLTWAALPGVTGCVATTIPLASITANAVVSAATQINTAATTSIVTDLASAWLMGCRPIAGVGIQILIAATPSNNANYGIAWAIASF